ncbi:MAG: hypothetical protein EBT69_05615 [Verrucomicrobia bacterium]|nr:hypothetical protein [Verrucomicrobiota bacterium]
MFRFSFHPSVPPGFPKVSGISPASTTPGSTLSTNPFRWNSGFSSRWNRSPTPPCCTLRAPRRNSISFRAPAWPPPWARCFPSVETTADFRAYPNLSAGFKGYADFLLSNERYSRYVGEKSGVKFVSKILRDPGSSAFDLLRRTREFERQLADVQEVHVRQEEIEAARQAIRARLLRRWAIAIGSLAFVGFALLWVFVLHHRFFLDVNATLNGEEIQVPSGQVLIDGKKVDVPAFSLDRHEVTIGEYEKFLQDLPHQDLSKLLPKNRPHDRKSAEQFIPGDWEDMLNRARKKERYQGQVITRDTPVFNVDYLSAFAYAKWKNRRLPKKEEWLHAASGKENLPYPWGTEERNPNINLGCNADPKKVADPSYFRVLPAESNPQDVGPYGHFDLGGNLSEWINSLDVNKTVDAAPPFIGGNYLDQAAVANSNAVRFLPADKGDPRIGFRTAR